MRDVFCAIERVTFPGSLATIVINIYLKEAHTATASRPRLLHTRAAKIEYAFIAVTLAAPPCAASKRGTCAFVCPNCTSNVFIAGELGSGGACLAKIRMADR